MHAAARKLSIVIPVLTLLCILAWGTAGHAQSSQPTLKLLLESNLGTRVLVEDNGLWDEDDELGVIRYSQTIDAFSVSTTLGMSKPLVGNPSEARMELNSTLATGDTGGTLTMYVTDTGFQLAPGSVLLTSSIGGTFRSLGGDGRQDTVTFQSYFDSANAPFGMSGPTVGTHGPQGPFRPSGYFADDAMTNSYGLGPFSLTSMAVVTLGAHGFETFGAAASAVPTSCTGRIGDFVWTDFNHNGIQDPGEPGIPGAAVTLALPNGSVASTQTDASGAYQFAGLCAGTYQVSVTTPSGDTPTLSLQGNDREKDSNASPSQVVLGADNTQDLSLDFGFAGPGSIGDRVWWDQNCDGIQTQGEPGIPAVQVNLRMGLNNTTGPIIAYTYTDGNGNYAFANLNPGDYTVEVITPGGFVPNTNFLGNKNNDSNGSPANVTIDSSSPNDATIDFGFCQTPCPGAIGDFVWTDLNANGIQDLNEPGIPGVVVTLAGPGGAQTTTNSMGFYQFTGLCPGNYVVSVAPQPALQNNSVTLLNQGNGTNDSKNPSGYPITIVNQTDTTADFGFVGPGAIGDYVWNDSNCNGIQDAGEPGIDGIPVHLILNSIEIKTVLTATGGPNNQPGYYQFGNVNPGTYTVIVDTPLGFKPSSTGQGNADTDSNGSPATVILTFDNPLDNSIDFGFCFVPSTANCAAITAIEGIAIIPVTMSGSGGTGGPYTFSATGLPAGLNISSDGTISGTPGASGQFDYTVTVKDKDGNSGGFNCSVVVNPPISANCVNITAVQSVKITPVTMTASGGAGEPYKFSAAGLPDGLTMSVNGTISGIPTESGTFTYTVTVKDKDDNIGTINCSVIVNAPPTASCVAIKAIQGIAIPPVVMTGSGGTGAPYIFSATGLPAGLVMASDGTISGIPSVNGTFAYTVTVEDKNGNSGSLHCSVTVQAPVADDCVAILAVRGVPITPVTLPASGGAGAPYTFSATGLPDGLNISTTGTISGTPTVSGTFNYTVTVKDKDDNSGSSNCSVTVNPPPTASCMVINAIQGITITPATMIGSGGAGGPYTFSATGLPDGLSMAPNGTISGTPTATGTFNTNVVVTDAAGNQGNITCSITVAPPPCSATIGNFVWYDVNLNGIQDTGEPGVKDVTVKLLDANGATLSAQVTGANGQYSFSGLSCGNYQVQLAVPKGYALTTVDATYSTPGTDSNPNPSSVAKVGGGIDLSIDFGLVNTEIECPPTAAEGVTTAGTLYWGIDVVKNLIYVRYDQSTVLNDNSYGAGSIGWKSRGHTFGDLLHSDKAEFVFRKTDGTKVLDFFLDYLSAKSGTPSGYGSLGPFGGDGSWVSGTQAYLKSWDSSFAKNLNGFCTAGSCTVEGLNLIVNSPPTVSSTSYELPAGSPFVGWNFVDSYEMAIDGAAFGGVANFGGVQVGVAHNSPPKTGVNAMYPTPCEPTSPSGGSTCSLNAGDLTLDKAQAKMALTNNGSSTATLGGLTFSWPASNGKLKQVKLDGDVAWGGPSASSPLTLSSSAFTADANKKSISAGATRTLVLVFEKDASKDQADYAMSLSFGSCTVSFSEPASPLELSCPGTTGQVGLAYSSSLAGFNGATPYTFSILSGSLPPGLTLNATTGAIIGTPTTGGTFSTTAKIADASGAVATNSCGITITDAPSCGLALGTVKFDKNKIKITVLNGTNSTATLSAILFSKWPAVNGKLRKISNGPDVVWDKADIAAPGPATLTGLTHGTIPAASSDEFTLEFEKTPVSTNPADYVLTLQFSGGCAVSPFEAPAVNLGCVSSNTGNVGVAYSSSLAASGGLAPYTFSVVSGSLPTGLTLNATTGAITGTPSAQGAFPFSIKVVDSLGTTGTHTATVNCGIAIGAPLPLAIGCGSATAGQVGLPFASSFPASGGTPPYTFSITGSLPPGLTLNPSTGAVTGTPTQQGTLIFVVKVEDALLHTAAVNCSIAIGPEANMCAYDTSSGANLGTGGSLIVTEDATTVTVFVMEPTTFNDNTYGVNAIGWSSGHKFSDLTGSDKAEFRFTDKNGTVVLDFYLDYISASTSVPSGYTTLGATGGDGRMLIGNASAILSYSTSFDEDLNRKGYGVVNGVAGNGFNLAVDSPATSPKTSYNVTDPFFKDWVFPITYTVTISKSVFGTAGFGGVTIPVVHNSPSKGGINAVRIAPCQ